jgi:hypothetical protein
MSRNYASTRIVSRPRMSWVQAPSLMAEATICCLLHVARIASIRSGARSPTLWPSSHGSDQKRKVFPSPSTREIEALKKAEVILSTPTGNAAHGRVGSTRSSHSHLTRRAKSRRRRSNTPRPPRCRGHCTQFQATMHFPFCTTSDPVQRKNLQIF